MKFLSHNHSSRRWLVERVESFNFQIVVDFCSTVSIHSLQFLALHLVTIGSLSLSALDLLTALHLWRQVILAPGVHESKTLSCSVNNAVCTDCALEKRWVGGRWHYYIYNVHHSAHALECINILIRVHYCDWLDNFIRPSFFFQESTVCLCIYCLNTSLV